MGASGDEQVSAGQGPLFYTVAEAAALLRVDRATLYRAIRDDAFPAVRVRSRYVIPAGAIQEMAAHAVSTGACVDVAAIAARRRLESEATQALGFRVGRG